MSAGHDLFAQYVANDADLMRFYARAPRDLFAMPPHPAPWDFALVEAIRKYNACLGHHPPFRGNEAVIVTGQQAGLFTGPLYTIYKAVTALRLAQELEATFATPCVPVFWVASDDHDFEEVRTAHLLAKTHEPLSLTYAPQEAVDGRPMYRIPLESSLHDLIDQAAHHVPGSEFRDEVARVLHETLDASSSLADWTARLLARLFRDTPLVLFAPHIPAARHVARSVLEQEIAEPGRTTAQVNAAGVALQKLGFVPQIVKGEEECHFFLEMGQRRRKVVWNGDGYLLPEEHLTCSTEDLRIFLASAPERFSPNVVLRCIVQQRLFPAAAYVAGPGEIAYWGQLKPVFDRFDCPMPVVYPRARAVLTSLKLDKLRRKFGFSIEDLGQGPDALAARALDHLVATPERAAVRRSRDAIEDALATLAADLEARTPNAAATARGLRERLRDGLDRVEQNVLTADAGRVETTRAQVARLCNALAPFGKPQERVYTAFSFLFEQGWELIPRLLDSLDIASFQRNEVML